MGVFQGKGDSIVTGAGGRMNGVRILSLLRTGCVTSATLREVFEPRCFYLYGESQDTHPPARGVLPAPSLRATVVFHIMMVIISELIHSHCCVLLIHLENLIIISS